MHEIRQWCELHSCAEKLGLGDDFLKLWHLPQLPLCFCWFTGESQKIHAWQAQKSQGKEKEAICILIMLKSHDYKVRFLKEIWSLWMLVFGNEGNSCFNHFFLWNESKFPTRIFNLWVAKFPLFEELWASKLLPIYTIGNKVNPITPAAVFGALILFPCSA